MSISIFATIIVLIINFKGGNGEKLPIWFKNILWIKTKSSVKILKYEYFIKNYFQNNTINVNDMQIDPIEEVLNLVKCTFLVLEKINAEKNLSQIIVNEWREVALKVDFIFLWIFISLNLIMSFILLKKIYINYSIFENYMYNCI